MTEVEILREMVGIYRKYFKVIETLGTLKMSPKDADRLKELKAELERVKA